jgi:hypothetical protein
LKAKLKREGKDRNIGQKIKDYVKVKNRFISVFVKCKTVMD